MLSNVAKLYHMPCILFCSSKVSFGQRSLPYLAILYSKIREGALMATTVQMNVRIDEKLKQAGDEALASIGMSPSQAVRLLWQRAAEHGEGLERVKALAQVAGSDSSEGERVNGIAEGRAVLERGIAALELDKARPLTVNDDELLEEAALERLHERGLR